MKAVLAMLATILAATPGLAQEVLVPGQSVDGGIDATSSLNSVGERRMCWSIAGSPASGAIMAPWASE